MKETKQCAKCGETKPLTGFNFDKNTKDGRDTWCKKCVSDHHTAYHAAHTELLVAKARKREAS
jgi:hypothetical protein